MPFRMDLGSLAQSRRTPQGGLRIPARLTRVGVFVYRRGDGTMQRELRLPDEVFHADSLATLAGAPVTDLHPGGAVTPETWRKVAVGHVGETVRRDEQYVEADLAIQDKDTMALVETGQRKELSCGYDCEIDMTAGMTSAGERYDAIQRTIRYNHVAIGPEGWGRAGKDVSLRLDSGDALQIVDAGNPKPERKEKHTMKMRIDGIDYEVGSPEFLQALERQQTRIATESADVKRRADIAEGKLDATIKELTETRTKLATAEDPKRIDTRVTERAALVTKAQTVLGAEYKIDGKSDREIMVDAIRKTETTFDAKDRSDDYIRGRFEALNVTIGRRDTVDALGRALQQPRQETHDDGPDPDKAYQQMLDDNAKAWKQPLAFSKQVKE